MTYEELNDATAVKVKDTSPKFVAMIPDAINEAVQQIADAVTPPSLKAMGTVYTVVSQEWVNVKTTLTDFSGKLLYAGTSSGKIGFYDGGLEALLAEYYSLDADGDVEAVALEGDILWYYKTPLVATSLTLVYCKVPPLLVSPGDIPVCLPSMLHRDLIVNKTAAIIYDHIEEGLEGEKVNTKACLELYAAAEARLNAWFAKRRSNVSRSVWSV